ncbi:hypothetical protein GMOD_00003524 [Pyrenophora seminiperda CCB06]|uniref:Uncharacterized protein n=1 Tax=Pyrenophora seminiperda CCB06 TaxID=1302712 RepID=A0A3M7MJE5_9PLEO|nr:hypothetical protein GMOD_00003524 [Pyrenophora seminiperda CCB06]
MKLLSSLLSLAALTAAMPPSWIKNSQSNFAVEPIVVQRDGDCDNSRKWCFDEVAWGKGIGYQPLLHTYCSAEYERDALSCHGCMRQPFPTDECAAAPAAWNSAFGCVNGEYAFAYRCENWCKEGQCV